MEFIASVSGLAYASEPKQAQSVMTLLGLLDSVLMAFLPFHSKL